MDTVWLTLLPFFAALVFILIYARPRPPCPDCRAPLPLFCSPLKKTRRMWRAGGAICVRCGCEADAAGQKVTADTPPPPFPAWRWAALAVACVAGVGLGATAVFIGAREAAPPVVAAPQQAPAALPVK